MRRFIERFAPYGFRPGALSPVYGLAENSLAVAFPPLGRPPRVDVVDRERLPAHGRGACRRRGRQPRPALRLLRRAAAGHEMRIVDEGGREVARAAGGAAGVQGAVGDARLLQQPRGHGRAGATASGGTPATAATSRPARSTSPAGSRTSSSAAGATSTPTSWRGRWARSPASARGASPCSAAPIRPRARSAWWSWPRPASGARTPWRRSARPCRDVAVDLLGTPADVVALVPPQGVPKTSSGKIRRSSARELYESGRVDRGGGALGWQIARLALSGFKAQAAPPGALARRAALRRAGLRRPRPPRHPRLARRGAGARARPAAAGGAAASPGSSSPASGIPLRLEGSRTWRRAGRGSWPPTIPATWTPWC